MGVFAQKLKELRLMYEASQAKVAAGVGISDTQYQRYEYGTSEPTISALLALSKYFNVSTSYLLGEYDSLCADYSAMGGGETFTETQEKLFALAGRLSEDDSRLLLAMAERLASAPPGDPPGRP